MEHWDPKKSTLLHKVTEKFTEDVGDKLVSLCLYGSPAHQDLYKRDARYHLLVVLSDLHPETLALCQDTVSWWTRNRKQPMPRFFSQQLLTSAADVFPVEFLDIRKYHIVLAGNDLFSEIAITNKSLRIRCEREMREKMFRLREGYVVAAGNKKPLKKLLSGSYVAFVDVFRAILHLLGEEIPMHNIDVARALCTKLTIDVSPFETLEDHKDGLDVNLDDALFHSYYTQLSGITNHVDTFDTN